MYEWLFVALRLCVLLFLSVGYGWACKTLAADVGDSVTAAWWDWIAGHLLLFYGPPTVFALAAIASRSRFRYMAVLAGDAAAAIFAGLLYPMEGLALIFLPFISLDIACAISCGPSAALHRRQRKA